MQIGDIGIVLKRDFDGQWIYLSCTAPNVSHMIENLELVTPENSSI
ncbi:MAG: hypothetical protein WC827_04085 [Candidatus Paceibacterota bacterium]|jgi:hypothetical protein